MRKIIEVSPTFILFIILISSLIQRSAGKPWINPFAFSLLGLCIYPPVALVIESIRVKKHKLSSRSESRLIWYLAIISISFLSLTTYLMVV
ncbi:hypothetical protein FD33_GL000895 [Companilactobacillus paralimentarius DSM 13238 = JCM 10415]|mgnify:CR=1 FL=1|jgi:hypothetical protein|uniref:Uncharacterized protein n=1 Tax=Companilactobacillus paralimentarius DSM 13238 = JCM 10415 TaxID=1122151 RepID=A0A0R1PU44_9LACO|nr:hypothetical protein [Companilactobacillus paralimentarius]KRL32267.1 hypothetical protein FD33_GL000895 [Companilactobacillus paralimentarius DSM 13238 = JCM 10415]